MKIVKAEPDVYVRRGGRLVLRDCAAPQHDIGAALALALSTEPAISPPCRAPLPSASPSEIEVTHAHAVEKRRAAGGTR
jgi:hypothetical protein